MSGELKRFEYPLEVTFTEGRKGKFSIGDKISLDFATPPEFRGPEGYISPEDLFVASVGTCIMSTWVTMSARAHVEWNSYRSKTTGILQQQEDRGYLFDEIICEVFVEVENEADIPRARRA